MAFDLIQSSSITHNNAVRTGPTATTARSKVADETGQSGQHTLCPSSSIDQSFGVKFVTLQFVKKYCAGSTALSISTMKAAAVSASAHFPKYAKSRVSAIFRSTRALGRSM